MDEVAFAIVALSMSPKSTAFPVDSIYNESIIPVRPGADPPQITPLVWLEDPVISNLVPVRSPKSVVLPVVAIVTNSIVLSTLGLA